MAEDLKVSLRLSAKDKGLRATLKRVIDRLKGTGKEADKTRKSTDRLGKSFGGMSGLASKAAAALSAYFGVRFFSGAIQGAADLEAQLDRVASVSGEYAQRIDDITAASEEMGATTAFTGQQAAEGFEEFARAGIDVDTAIASMSSTLALAKAESLDLAAAADIVTGNLKLWSDEGETAATISDKLKGAASNSRTSVEQLNRAMIDAGPLAKAMGLSLDETVGILGKFADAGFRGERGGTAVKIILGQLEDPASKARKALADLGFEGDDFIGMLEALEQAGPGANNAIRAFGTEAGPALRAVLGQGSAAVRDLIAKIRESEGAAQAAADKMSGNLNGAMIGLGSAWDAVKNSLAKPLLGPLAEQVSLVAARFREWVADGSIARIGESLKTGFEAGVKAVKEFIGEFDFKQVTADFQAFVADMGERLKGLKQSYRDFSDTSGGLLAGLTVAWNLFTAGVKGAASVLVASLAALLVPIDLALQGLNKLGGVSDETTKRFSEMRNGLKEVAAEFSRAASVDVKDMGVALGVVTEEAGQTTTALDQVGDALTKAGDAAAKTGGAVTKAGDAISHAATEASEDWREGANVIASAGEAIGGTLSVVTFEGWKTAEEVEAAFKRMGIKTKDQMDALAETVREDWNTIRLSGKASADGLVEAAKRYLDAWKTTHDGVLPKLKDLTVAHGDLYLAMLEVEKGEKRIAKAAAEAGEAGKKAGDDIAAGMDKATKAIDVTTAATETLAEASRRQRAEAAPANTGGTINTGQYDRVAATGDAQAIAEFERFLDSGKTYLTLEAMLTSAAAAANRAIAGAERREREANEPPRPGSTASQLAVATMKIDFTGPSGSGSIDASGDTDAFLANLELANARSNA